MKVCAIVVLLLVVMGWAPPVTAQTEEAERVVVSTRVLGELTDATDSAIPGAVLERAEAIAIFPSTFKAGFIFGGHRGRGVISVIDRETGTWSTPAFLTLTGASFGLQIGGVSPSMSCSVLRSGSRTSSKSAGTRRLLSGRSVAIWRPRPTSSSRPRF